MSNKIKLLPCPFCGVDAEFDTNCGTQASAGCSDCDIWVHTQKSDNFTYDERFSNPDFQWRGAPHNDYGIGGELRTKEVLANEWNTRHDNQKLMSEQAELLKSIIENHECEDTYQLEMSIREAKQLLTKGETT